jgi:ribonuclease HII
VNATVVNPLFVAGIDEAGRGPLAGPVTAACVCLPHDYSNPEISDSKKLSAEKREKLYEEIVRAALAFSAVSVGPRRIEHLNILRATKLSMQLAAARVAAQLRRGRRRRAKVYYLVDGNAPLATSLAHETIIKGDEKIQAIGAASIIAKVTRDRLMRLLDGVYPGYGFSEHKGYGTELHRSRIASLGPSRIHRRSFAGVREFVLFTTQEVFAFEASDTGNEGDFIPAGE